ncbi:MAG: hypothetical protein SNJ75_06835 [Gemmataceae bacterium]
MRVMAPEILELTRQLSPVVSLILLALGTALWLYGGRTHRFWLALVITLGGGLFGLQIGRDFGVQPLVSGLLLSLAAGALSLALARVVVFVLGGVAALVVMKSLANGWNDYLCFLIGGLTSILLYPVWIAVLSSTAGTVLMAYGLLSVLDKLFRIDSVGLANNYGALMNWILAGWVILGMILQYTIERWVGRPAGEPKPTEAASKKDEKKDNPKADPLPWWHWKSLVNKANKAA